MKTQTKTKTVVGVGLIVLSVGTIGFASAMYYYGGRLVQPYYSTSGGSIVSSSCYSKCLNECSSKTPTPTPIPSPSPAPSPSPTPTPTPAPAPTPSPSSDSDLSDLIVSAFQAPSTLDNNSPTSVFTTVRNQGTGSAGAFTVTVYAGPSRLPGGTVLTTWNVPGLAAGQSISQTFSNLIVNGLATHCNCNFVVEADSGRSVAETDETNNARYRYVFVAR